MCTSCGDNPTIAIAAHTVCQANLPNAEFVRVMGLGLGQGSGLGSSARARTTCDALVVTHANSIATILRFTWSGWGGRVGCEIRCGTTIRLRCVCKYCRVCGMLMAAMRWLALSCAVVSAGMRWLCRASVLPVCSVWRALHHSPCPHRCVRCCSVANRGGSLLLAGCHASESICVEKSERTPKWGE